MQPAGQFNELLTHRTREGMVQGPETAKNPVTRRIDSHEGPLRASDGGIEAAARGSQDAEEVVQPLSLLDSASVWDGSKLVRLTPWTLMPKPGVSDWFKDMVESLAQHPIEAVRDYLSTCTLITTANPGQRISSSHNTSGNGQASNSSTARTSQSGTASVSYPDYLPSFHQRSSITTQPQSQLPQSQLILPVTQDCYVHWCVNASKWETQLHLISVPHLSDGNFIQKLKENYDMTFGFWRWLSLTTIHSVKFVVVCYSFLS